MNDDFASVIWGINHVIDHVVKFVVQWEAGKLSLMQKQMTVIEDRELEFVIHNMTWA